MENEKEAVEVNMENEKEVVEVNMENEKEVVEVNMEGKKERVKKIQHIFRQRNSYEKFSLVERRELAWKVKEWKKDYVAQLESMRGRFWRLRFF